MYFSLVFNLAIAVLVLLLDRVGADNCRYGSQNVGGNWYCQKVKSILYSNVGKAGVYKQITAMNKDGSCSYVSKKFSGPISPFNEEISLHFRGPIHLKQLATYTLQQPKRRHVHPIQNRKHFHQHQHEREGHREERPVLEKRKDVWVTATINGQIVSWINNYFGGAPAPSTTSTTHAKTPTTTPTKAATIKTSLKPIITTTSSKQPLKPTVSSPGTSSSYTRSGYYDSTSGHLDGLTFLGSYGGIKSGVFDYAFGSSLAYLSTDGNTGAASSSILKDTVIGSNKEFAVMTAKSCKDGGCGYVRPESVAYHGFDGADKIFLMEFSMPLDGNRGFNGDMPAIWFLNAQVPRTLQYSTKICSSCWATGCGEMDIMEVLAPGDLRCKSTIHDNASGGDSDYIARPTGATIKMAVVFSSRSSTVHISILDQSTNFGTSLTAAQVNKICTAATGRDLSTFSMPS